MQQSILQNGSKFEMKSWLWTETTGDLPNSIKAAPNSSGIYSKKNRLESYTDLSTAAGVFMKTRCYTPLVQQLCSQWDQKLATLCDDLHPYQEGGESAVRPFNKFESRARIFTVLERECVQSVHRYSFVRCWLFIDDGIFIFILFRLVALLNEKINVRDSRIIFASKLVSALADLCPNLRRCVNTLQVVVVVLCVVLTVSMLFIGLFLSRCLSAWWEQIVDWSDRVCTQLVSGHVSRLEEGVDAGIPTEPWTPVADQLHRGHTTVHACKLRNILQLFSKDSKKILSTRCGTRYWSKKKERAVMPSSRRYESRWMWVSRCSRVSSNFARTSITSDRTLYQSMYIQLATYNLMCSMCRSCWMSTEKPSLRWWTRQAVQY